MKSYTPYENVAAGRYPAILAVTSLNDTRVLYHEPAKWIARLRARRPAAATYLLKTEMGAGHGGPSGRYDAWREEAFVIAWILDAGPGLTAATGPPPGRGRSPLAGTRLRAATAGRPRPAGRPGWRAVAAPAPADRGQPVRVPRRRCSSAGRAGRRRP